MAEKRLAHQETPTPLTNLLERMPSSTMQPMPVQFVWKPLAEKVASKTGLSRRAATLFAATVCRCACSVCFRACRVARLHLLGLIFVLSLFCLVDALWQWHLARQGGHAPCPICRKIISKKDLFQVSNKKVDTSTTNEAQKKSDNEGTGGEMDDANILDLLTEQADRPEDETDKAERVCLYLIANKKSRCAGVDVHSALRDLYGILFVAGRGRGQ